MVRVVFDRTATLLNIQFSAVNACKLSSSFARVADLPNSYGAEFLQRAKQPVFR